MTFRGRSVVASWSLAAGDKVSGCPASRLIATASWTYGATATAAATPPRGGSCHDGVRGAREEPATTCRARSVIAELSPAARLRELVPGVRALNAGVRACSDSCNGAPGGRGHLDSIRIAGTATMTFRSVGLEVR